MNEQEQLPGTETAVLFKVNETIGLQKSVTYHELMKGVKKVPSLMFTVLYKNKVTRFSANEEDYIFHIGKSANNNIVVEDTTVGDKQVAVVRVGETLYFMDCGLTDMVYFNGVKCRQVISNIKKRMVIKIANTIIICNEHCRPDISTEAPESEILLKIENQQAISDADPLLIGSDSCCDIVIGSNEQAHPIHAMVYFNNRGLQVEDFTHGKPGLKVNGVASIGVRPVTEDVQLQIGTKKIYLYVYGDSKKHCSILFANFKATPSLAFTNLKVALAPVVLPKTSQKLSIGRDDTANIMVPDESVSRIHAFIMIKEKCLYVTDNNSFNHTFVNGEEFSKGVVTPGDIIDFGETSFFLHYE